MSRRSRSGIEHSKASKTLNVGDGVADALDKVRELNEAEEEEEEVIPVAPGLRDLVLFGKVVEDFKVGNHTIRISTLTNRQQKELVRRLVSLDNEERLMNVKTFTLAEAIISINNLPLEDLYSGRDGLSISDMKVEVVSELQSALVDKLFDKYEELVKKSNSFFEDGDLGEQVKN